jgi:hypothetical protein
MGMQAFVGSLENVGIRVRRKTPILLAPVRHITSLLELGIACKEKGRCTQVLVQRLQSTGLRSDRRNVVLQTRIYVVPGFSLQTRSAEASYRVFLITFAAPYQPNRFSSLLTNPFISR